MAVIKVIYLLIYSSVLQLLFMKTVARAVLMLLRLPLPRYSEVQEIVDPLQIDWPANLALFSSVSVYQKCLFVCFIGIIMKYSSGLSRS